MAPDETNEQEPPEPINLEPEPVGGVSYGSADFGESIDPGISTPLGLHEPGGVVPPAPLWAMKDRRHFFGIHGHGDAQEIRRAIGAGDDTVYFIDDGREHCMIGRRVGGAPDGLIYCLVGRIKLDVYEDIDNGSLPVNEVFSKAHDIELCAVYEDENAASNVTSIQHYRHPSDIPSDYLPLSPYIEFEDVEDDSSTDAGAES